MSLIVWRSPIYLNWDFSISNLYIKFNVLIYLQVVLNRHNLIFYLRMKIVRYPE
jgi:hypothetical protein